MKELYLYSNQIGPSQAQYVAQILSNKRKLTSLGLSNNQIAEEGALILAKDGLSQKKELVKLSLEGNFIGSVGLEAIAKALMDNTEL